VKRSEVELLLLFAALVDAAQDKSIHEKRVAWFLRSRLKPQYILTLSSENPAIEDDLNQVLEYGMELLARRYKQHVLWFAAGSSQPRRKDFNYHLHVLLRFEREDSRDDLEHRDVGKGLWNNVRMALNRAAKRSSKKLYRKTAKNAGNCTVFAKNPEEFKRGIQDLRLDVRFERFEPNAKREKSGFEKYTIVGHDFDSLKIKFGCPRQKSKCNRVVYEATKDGSRLKGTGKRVCGLDGGNMLDALPANW
jgi:hypothetical protein